MTGRYEFERLIKDQHFLQSRSEYLWNWISRGTEAVPLERAIVFVAFILFALSKCTPLRLAFVAAISLAAIWFFLTGHHLIYGANSALLGIPLLLLWLASGVVAATLPAAFSPYAILYLLGHRPNAASLAHAAAYVWVFLFPFVALSRELPVLEDIGRLATPYELSGYLMRNGLLAIVAIVFGVVSYALSRLKAGEAASILHPVQLAAVLSIAAWLFALGQGEVMRVNPDSSSEKSVTQIWYFFSVLFGTTGYLLGRTLRDKTEGRAYSKGRLLVLLGIGVVGVVLIASGRDVKEHETKLYWDERVSAWFNETVDNGDKAEKVVTMLESASRYGFFYDRNDLLDMAYKYRVEWQCVQRFDLNSSRKVLPEWQQEIHSSLSNPRSDSECLAQISAFQTKTLPVVVSRLKHLCAIGALLNCSN